LLDRFAAHETKKKNEQQRGDWLALVQLLLRSDSTRLRTSTRIIHVSSYRDCGSACAVLSSLCIVVLSWL
jgi:hypothetical protein